MKDKLIRWGGPALVLGGLLWVLTYAVEIVIGVTLGAETYARPDASASLLEWLWPVTFAGAILALGVGLLGVAARVGARARVAGYVGAVLPCVAIGAATVTLVTLSGALGAPSASDDVGFLGVIGVVAGAIVVGIGTLRAAVLPRWSRWVLALLPLFFVPAIIATIPLESVAPDYVVADLPFPVVGLALAAVGRAMLRDRAPAGGQALAGTPRTQ